MAIRARRETTPTPAPEAPQGWPPLPVGARINVVQIWRGKWSARATSPHGHSELAGGPDPAAALEALRLALHARVSCGEVFT